MIDIIVKIIYYDFSIRKILIVWVTEKSTGKYKIFYKLNFKDRKLHVFIQSLDQLIKWSLIQQKDWIS